jgi:hypothetical protein
MYPFLVEKQQDEVPESKTRTITSEEGEQIHPVIYRIASLAWSKLLRRPSRYGDGYH